MPQRDVEITISKNGEVKVHIKGIKGKACLKFGAFLADVVGKVKSQQLTSEYYEPEEKAAISQEQKLRRGK
jgi:hypothetical protein